MITHHVLANASASTRRKSRRDVTVGWTSGLDIDVQMLKEGTGLRRESPVGGKLVLSFPA